MKTTYKIAYGIVGVWALIVLSVLIGWSISTKEAVGSVSVTDEYQATSTAAGGVYGAFTAGRVIKTGRGALGSWVVTGANTGVVNFYDATTTNVNLRTGQKATSTIHLASFPASIVAGTYTLDVEFTDGLYFDLISGSAPTSTITYR